MTTTDAEAPTVDPANGGSAAEPSMPMSMWGAAFLGIGSMVGAGIFALLGEAGAVAGSAVWISFLIAGAISGSLGYTLVKLGVRYPSSGGIVTYLIKGFGVGRTVGIATWLGYLTAIVVVGAMVAVSFGEYAAALFLDEPPGGGWTTAFAILILLASAGVGLIGTRWVERSQTAIVIALLLVFGVFIVATFGTLDTDLLSPSDYPPLTSIVSSVALTFFAFLGFAVISFAAGEMSRPKRDLPRAMYLALGATTLLYVAVSLGVFGTLTADEVVAYGPTAIAEAARPTLGDAGFVAMSIAALLATSSSVNATLYAANPFTSALAEVDLFPPIFGRGSRLGPNAGLLITAAVTIAFVVLFDLGQLASIGSAVSLAVFILLGLAGLRLRKEIGARWAIVLLGVAFSVVVLALFVVDTLDNDPKIIVSTVILVILAALTDTLWRRSRRRADETPQAA